MEPFHSIAYFLPGFLVMRHAALVRGGSEPPTTGRESYDLGITVLDRTGKPVTDYGLVLVNQWRTQPSFGSRRYDLGVKRALPAITGLTLLAGCTAAPAPPPVVTTSSTPQPEDECAKHGVTFDVTGADAAMGLRVLTLEMENCGSALLTVNGYPSLRLLDEDRKELDVAVLKGSGDIATMPDWDTPPQEVTLQPGEKAKAGLVWRNLVTDSTVKATTASRMEAAPAEGQPRQDVPLVVPNEVSGSMTVDIDLGNTGKLGVQPWTKA